MRAGAPRPPCTPSPGRANPPFTTVERWGSSVAVPGWLWLLWWLIKAEHNPFALLGFSLSSLATQPHRPGRPWDFG